MYKINVGTIHGKNVPQGSAQRCPKSPEAIVGIIEYVLSDYHGTELVGFKVAESGGGDWEAEKIVVAEIDPGSFTLERISGIVRRICLIANQDSVAVLHEASDTGWLHWNDECSTPESDRPQFDLSYFVR